ncbi:MAG: AraC family transcriptional regulator [Gemmatimonadales bacterium]
MSDRNRLAESNLATGVAIGEGARRRRPVAAGRWRAVEAQYGAGLARPLHSHRGTVVAALFHGAAVSRCLGREHACEPLDVLVIPAEVPHTETFLVEGSRVITVELDPDLGGPLDRWTAHQRQPVRARGATVARLAAEMERECRVADELAPLAVEGLVLQLLAVIARGEPDLRGASRPVQRIADRIAAEFAEPLTIAQLARDEGIHPVYLARAFRRLHGCGPADYLRQLRIDHAATLLRQSDLPLARVAAAVGYADQSHFHRQFQRRMGVTPGAYRRRAGGTR